MRYALVLLIVCAPAFGATTFDQLRQRLGELRGTTTVAGKIEIFEEARRPKKRVTRRGGAEFECDHALLRVAVPAARPDAGEEPADVDLDGLRGRLNAAPALVDELQRATVIGEQASTWKGRPATRLELRIEPERPDDVPRLLKVHADMRRIFWIASDGTLLASESRGKFSARFLLISASGESTSSEEYEAVGDRLVILREVTQRSGSALGEKGGQTTITTVSLRQSRQ